MPWKRRSISGGNRRLLLWVLAAALGSGALACLAGSLLDEKCSALISKYSAYKSITGNYSQDEIKAALKKRGIVPR
ncbi:MAG TPA: hypothetical protein DEQ38_04620 [Elusimicrobia bacterium]|nr:MAG: hypothetical protein A2089_00585 [Elusimicrobia bacterium GWD2_63_28]HCC47385.1 hypothetical protein [Elusimicrobiota bacterium]